MRKKFFVHAGLLSALLLSLALTVSAQTSGKNESANAANDQGWLQVFPGMKQTITGADRQQVQIARETRHELAMLPYYSIFDNLKYRVDGSTVTLGGQVITLGLKRDAETAVKGVEGVTKVVNQIEELPPFSDDQRIREAVARRRVDRRAVRAGARAAGQPAGRLAAIARGRVAVVALLVHALLRAVAAHALDHGEARRGGRRAQGAVARDIREAVAADVAERRRVAHVGPGDRAERAVRRRRDDREAHGVAVDVAGAERDHHRGVIERAGKGARFQVSSMKRPLSNLSRTKPAKRWTIS